MKDDLNAIKTEISSITKKLQKERAKLDVEGQPCDILKMFAVCVFLFFFCFSEIYELNVVTCVF